MSAITSLIDYGKFFLSTLRTSTGRNLLNAHRQQLRIQPVDHGEWMKSLTAAADHLERSLSTGQDAGSGSYHLVHGWGPSYPETTGYMLPTLFALSDRSDRKELADRAMDAASWLVSVQLPEGGWPGGRIGEGRPAIVFNTAQVIRGLLAVHERTREERFAHAIRAAADWIVSVQRSDGSWSEHNFLGRARTYDSYVAAPLLQAHAQLHGPSWAESAERNLRWVLSRQQSNGWFADCDNTVEHNDRPVTHTLAYTIDGLLECHRILGRSDLLEAARIPSLALLDAMIGRKRIHGRYDSNWHGSELPIPTGCAQLALCWHALWELTKDTRFLQGSRWIMDWSIAVQRTSFLGPADVHGALPGSFPLWGRYEKFAFPNWATKYFVDALLCVEPLRSE